ncbi:hypothetical protein KIL84_013893 [Mauremys mutica]|uniref:Uncharacterized protein n=1 Tax=Mauremys mutica TaxID=74926 RepID=A0A9D4ASJ7_9SAUR|nr:hypothetical protein KIL84_013893 [Mauremys mutica]
MMSAARLAESTVMLGRCHRPLRGTLLKQPRHQGRWLGDPVTDLPLQWGPRATQPPWVAGTPWSSPAAMGGGDPGTPAIPGGGCTWSSSDTTGGGRSLPSTQLPQLPSSRGTQSSPAATGG